MTNVSDNDKQSCANYKQSLVVVESWSIDCAVFYVPANTV